MDEYFSDDGRLTSYSNEDTESEYYESDSEEEDNVACRTRSRVSPEKRPAKRTKTDKVYLPNELPLIDEQLKHLGRMLHGENIDRPTTIRIIVCLADTEEE